MFQEIYCDSFNTCIACKNQQCSAHPGLTECPCERHLQGAFKQTQFSLTKYQVGFSKILSMDLDFNFRCASGVSPKKSDHLLQTSVVRFGDDRGPPVPENLPALRPQSRQATLGSFRNYWIAEFCDSKGKHMV